MDEIKPIISYEDFAKLDIRIGTILAVSEIEGADKLLVLTVDLGSEKRTICAGIKPYYRAEDLVGKQVPILCNLAPRVLRGVESQGMILVASGQELAALNPDKFVVPGTSIS